MKGRLARIAPGPARLELAVLLLHHEPAIDQADDPDRTGPFGVADPVISRLSHIRTEHARLESNQRPLASKTSALSAELRAFENGAPGRSRTRTSAVQRARACR
jgi:hypothetical protein